MRRFIALSPALLVLIVVALVLGLGPRFLRSVQLAQLDATVRVAQARLDNSGTTDDQDPARRGPPASRSVADAVLPGVVHIDVTIAPSDDQSRTDEEVRRRFGNPQLPPSHPAIPSTGSGWLYDRAGHVVTNAHVVRDARDIRVELYDGRIYSARVVGRDDATDVAVIVIDAGDTTLFPLRRATRDPVHVGDRVFVFGSPFGFKFSMSQGIVSALGRSEAAGWLGMLGGYTNYIQTDAAMNPGNSGGPMVSDTGRVIGMNTAIANSRTESGNFGQGQNAGLGFAIPIETVENVAQQLIGTGIVIRGFLGVRLGELTPDRARALRFTGRGVLVGGDSEIEPDTPAGKAGIRRGDIITAFSGKPTPDADVLRSMISIRKPGERVTLDLWRDGARITIEARLGAAYTVVRGPGFFQPRHIPGGEDMTPDQLRDWVRGQSDDR